MRWARLALVVPLLAIGLGAASAAARTGPATPLCAQAAAANHVGIVIEHDNRVKHHCVSFTSTTILALTVLEESGFEYATQVFGGIGEAVCQIDNVPAQYTRGACRRRARTGCSSWPTRAEHGPARRTAFR